jgi:hypothetical protein
LISRPFDFLYNNCYNNHIKERKRGMNQTVSYTPDKEIINLKWELDRKIEALNNKFEHLAICALWDVVNTISTTLLIHQNLNPNVLSLTNFIQTKWTVD